MKKLLFILAITALFAACEKDNTEPIYPDPPAPGYNFIKFVGIPGEYGFVRCWVNDTLFKKPVTQFWDSTFMVIPGDVIKYVGSINYEPDTLQIDLWHNDILIDSKIIYVQYEEVEINYIVP